MVSQSRGRRREGKREPGDLVCGKQFYGDHSLFEILAAACMGREAGEIEEDTERGVGGGSEAIELSLRPSLCPRETSPEPEASVRVPIFSEQA